MSRFRHKISLNAEVLRYINFFKIINQKFSNKFFVFSQAHSRKTDPGWTFTVLFTNKKFHILNFCYFNISFLQELWFISISVSLKINQYSLYCIDIEGQTQGMKVSGAQVSRQFLKYFRYYKNILRSDLNFSTIYGRGRQKARLGLAKIFY